MKKSPATALVVIAPSLILSAIVRSLVVEGINATGDVRQLYLLPLSIEGSLVHGETHDGRRPSANLNTLDAPERGKRLADCSFIHMLCQIEKTDCAVKVLWPGWDLPELQYLRSSVTCGL